MCYLVFSASAFINMLISDGSGSERACRICVPVDICVIAVCAGYAPVGVCNVEH
jgi:hypothetical protein